MPSRDKLLSKFGRNVSRFRDQAGLSQDKLAEKADLLPSANGAPHTSLWQRHR
jgi:transcriptional regulator with XRE-family HTH domain